MQIRTRLTLQFILMVALISLLSLYAIYYFTKAYIENQFYNELSHQAEMSAEMILMMKAMPPDTSTQATKKGPHSGFGQENIVIYNQNDSLIFINDKFSIYEFSKRTLSNLLTDIRRNDEIKFKYGIWDAIGKKFWYKDDQYTMIAFGANFLGNKELKRLQQLLISIFIFNVLLVTFAGWFFSGRAMKPISVVMNKVDDIKTNDLSQRLATDEQGDEISRLILTFNRLLDRVESAFNLQKGFISNVSHELKNPLTVMLSQLEVTLMKERNPEIYKSTLESLVEDVKELNDIVDNLMQLSHMSNPRNEVSLQKIRVDELIDSAKYHITRLNPEYKVQFEIISLPDNENHLYVDASETLLRTALVKIIENGCKYSVDHLCRIYLKYDGKQCVLEISDNGPGITNEDLPLIFEPFYRSKSVRPVKGHGIGLSLARSILNAYHVKMNVSSVPGTGTVFTLYFPTSKPELV